MFYLFNLESKLPFSNFIFAIKIGIKATVCQVIRPHCSVYYKKIYKANLKVDVLFINEKTEGYLGH